MIRETLGNFQITPNLTENIHTRDFAYETGRPIRQQTTRAVGQSLFPRLAVALLMLGVGNQHFSRFQKPYSFDAASEMTVELIEAPIVLNLESKPDVRTQLGNVNTPSRNNELNQQSKQPEYKDRFAASAGGSSKGSYRCRYYQTQHYTECRYYYREWRTLGARNFHLQQN